MAGWHHWLDGRESEWTPGVGDGQGGLACCDSWGRKESDRTEQLIWSDLILIACEMSTIVWQFEYSLALPFFGIGVKTDLFLSCGHCWVFQIFWYVECIMFTESSLRIWNILAGIPSPPLALFIIMFPKAHLTSHSRISDPRWVITPSWLSRSLRPFFVQFCCAFFSILLNIFCFC